VSDGLSLRHRIPGVKSVCALLLVLFAAGAAAQADRPLRIILPVAAGSGVDTITRAVGPSLSKALGQAVVIENMPGAGSVTGTAALVKAPADGSHIGLVSNNHVINPSVYAKMPFDSIADITPIMVVGHTPLVLVANPSRVPARSLQEFVGFLKAKPGAYNYASSGNGTILHLAAEMFLNEAKADVKHIPYKGVGPMVTDLLAGQVEWGIAALPSVQGHVKTGALRAIAINGKQRTAAAPDIATFAEQGMPGYDAEAWFAVVGPAKMPAAAVSRIHAGFLAALATSEVKEAMAKQGNIIDPSSPEAAASFFRTELAKYAAAVKRAGIKID
jgi:tripartite-type tricarboxylate transporter receptor subunit TctC